MTRNAAKPPSFMSLIPLWLAALKRRGSLRMRAGEKDESAPPKPGGHAAFRRGTLWRTSTRPHGVALVLIYPCGKALVALAVHAAPRSGLADVVGELRAEVARAERTRTMDVSEFICRCPLLTLLIG